MLVKESKLYVKMTRFISVSMDLLQVDFLQVTKCLWQTILFASEKLLLRYTVEFHSYFCNGAEVDKEGIS